MIFLSSRTFLASSHSIIYKILCCKHMKSFFLIINISIIRCMKSFIYCFIVISRMSQLFFLIYRTTKIYYFQATRSQSDMRDVATRICREYLSGAWKNISSEEIQVKRMRYVVINRHHVWKVKKYDAICYTFALSVAAYQTFFIMWAYQTIVTLKIVQFQRKGHVKTVITMYWSRQKFY